MCQPCWYIVLSTMCGSTTTNDIEKQIVDITSANPRSFDLGFSTWSLRVLAGFLMNDLTGR